MLPALTSSAVAECSNLAIDPIDRVNVGAAFLATVAEASGDVDPNPDANPWEWHLELAVEATYYGHVPKSLSFNGYDGGCAEFQGGALQTGDRIIVATEMLPLSYLPGAPFEGHIVVWRKASEGWAFAADALAFGSQPAFYGGPAREATTKAQILRVISDWTMPATSTLDERPDPRTSDAVPWTALAFAIGLVLSLLRLRTAPRGHGEPTPSRDIARR
jgi:hypothetical protein